MSSTMERSSKRSRLAEEAATSRKTMSGRDSGGDPMGEAVLSLPQLLQVQNWAEVMARVRFHPEDAAVVNPSPLAMACRLGAPLECVRCLLDAAPQRLRHVLDSRGTPLHEAIVCESTSVDVIRILLEADEALEGKSIDDSNVRAAVNFSPTRATLLQDVDGFTPLHLLIRRRFQSHILSAERDMSLLEILEMLVISCPEAVVIPDRGEYEEPPIVYALKANLYAPLLLGPTEDDHDIVVWMERQIYEMVRTMLKHAPFAAAQIFNGFRGQYSPLHSAVFHGRYTNTIDLLLQAEERFPSEQKAALLTNTQAELPLHFCAMRGERPRTVILLAKAAPEAVLKRDASGLTPFHWLWVRFVSTMLSLAENSQRMGGEESIVISIRANPQTIPYETNHYNIFTAIEQGDFESDLQLIKRLDPPVDFLRMRHIPTEAQVKQECLRWANTSIEVLHRIRERQGQLLVSEEQLWTRQEAVIGLFWTKAVSLLEASRQAGENMPVGDSVLLHTAFASPSCLAPVAHLVANLFSEEIVRIDGRGRLPIHYAASRPWHAWDWPRQGGVNAQASARLLNRESLDVLKVAIDLSPCNAMRVADNYGRLVIHQVVDTFVKACSQPARSTTDNPMEEMLETLHSLIEMYPDCLYRRDGRTKLPPFLQAAAVAAEEQDQAYVHDELALSVTFALLRENPCVLRSLRERDA